MHRSVNPLGHALPAALTFIFLSICAIYPYPTLLHLVCLQISHRLPPRSTNVITYPCSIDCSPDFLSCRCRVTDDRCALYRCCACRVTSLFRLHELTQGRKNSRTIEQLCTATSIATFSSITTFSRSFQPLST